MPILSTSLDVLKKRFLYLCCNWASLTRAHCNLINRTNRSYLNGCAGKKNFVGRVEVLAWNVRLLDAVAEFFC